MTSGCDAIIADDIYGKSKLLANAGTALTAEVVNRLVEHGIVNVRVGDTRIELNNKPSMPVVETAEFERFTATYNGVLSIVKQELSSIIGGSQVESEKIINPVFSLTKIALAEANVLNYIRYVKHEEDSIYAHSLNTGLLCSLFGEWLGLPIEDKATLTIAGMLHDVGKTKIPNEILYKPGRLTNEEFAIVKRHTTIGYELLRDKDISNAVKTAALQHHEKLDGKGYPMMQRGSAIDKVAMTVEICDCYEAMTSNRVYRPRLSPFFVVGQFEHGEFGKLGNAQVRMFLKKIAKSFKGSKVQLSDGQEGKVVGINCHALSKPLVQVENGYIDLSKSTGLDISAVL